ncbi:hypothetical protein H1R20_g16218, partial [Candolleomyces eurysporus]
MKGSCGFSDFGGFPGAGGGAGGPTFTFTTSGPGGSYTSFNPSDPNKIFESIFGGNSPLFGMGGLGNMGGMGGMGGGPRRGRAGSTNIFVDQDDDMSGFSSGFGGMPGGMPRPSRQGHPNGRSAGGARRDHSPEKPTEITKPLKVSLHDLYDGATKRLKVGRKLLNGTTEEKVLEIQIQPGWKSGTKIRFPKAGNETSYGEAQDIVFVVEEKPDLVFRRDGNDLIAKVDIPLVEALTGAPGSGKKAIDMLDGRKLQVTVPSGIVQPNQRSVVSGEGMPIRKDGQVRRKGDLIVEWNVVFPTSLTASQKEGLQKILS